jgi:DHA1 family bicyclomycin/chloramphenicol resistance-like MFS transporter
MTPVQTSHSHGISAKEFTVLVASLMSIVAISIDALLPALGVIGADLKIAHPNHAQYIISALFFGMALGQLMCGPLSDACGRKPVLYAGTGLFLVGTVVCFFAQSLEVILIGRFIQGLGVAGPYISAISLVRDQYSGRQMAKVMSLVMMIFITVPALAPTLGQAILFFASWHYIFVLYAIYALVIVLWIFLRLNETLPKANRIPFTAKGFLDGFKEVLSNRATLGYTLCMGLFFGSFIGYLNSSQQIFQVQFATGQMFAVYFGVLALVLGFSSMVNSRIVVRLGMHYICNRAVIGIIASSAVFLQLHFLMEIQLWMFVVYATVLFFCFGLVFGNLNALAMEPMGHVAGIASAIIGAVSSILSMTIGTCIGQLYDNNLMPIATGFLVMGSLAFVIMQVVDAKKIPDPDVA